MRIHNICCCPSKIIHELKLEIGLKKFEGARIVMYMKIGKNWLMPGNLRFKK